MGGFSKFNFFLVLYVVYYLLVFKEISNLWTSVKPLIHKSIIKCWFLREIELCFLGGFFWVGFDFFNIFIENFLKIWNSKMFYTRYFTIWRFARCFPMFAFQAKFSLSFIISHKILCFIRRFTKFYVILRYSERFRKFYIWFKVFRKFCISLKLLQSFAF